MAIQKPADPVKVGYTFKGWTPSVPATMPAEDLTFTAVFESVAPSVFTLTYNANGGSGAPANQTGNGNITLSTEKPSRNGYIFLGWATSSTATTAKYQPGGKINLTANTTLYAVWKKDEAPSNPTIAIRNFTANKTVDYKTTITFTAEVKNAVSGAAVHWFIDGQDKGTGDTYTVSKAKKSFTVQVKYIKDGKTLAESGVEKVNVKTGFFAKLAAFFRSIFGALPKVVQGYLGVEIIEKFIP